MICTGIEYYGEEEIIKKEKKTQINKKADTSYIIAGICYNTCNIFTKDSKDNKAYPQQNGYQQQ